MVSCTVGCKVGIISNFTTVPNVAMVATVTTVTNVKTVTTITSGIACYAQCDFDVL